MINSPSFCPVLTIIIIAFDLEIHANVAWQILFRGVLVVYR